MGSPTNLSADAVSEVETKVSPVRISEQNPYKTRVTGSDGEAKATIVAETFDSKRPKRFKTVSATVLGGLVLAGGLFSAGYLLNSNSSRSNADTGTTNVNSVTVPSEFFTIRTENANVSDTNNSNANSVLANTKLENKPQNETSVKQSETTRNSSKETKKQTGNSRGAAKSDESADEENVFTVNGDESIETKDMIIDEKGIRMKMPRQPMMPPVPPEQLKYLTPEQIQKLENLRKFEQLKNAQKRIIVVKPPTPKPTP
jgi:hypothetical protein